MIHLEDIGAHYTTTLRHWRANFLSNRANLRRLGYDDRFIRRWDSYRASCEGGFRARATSDVQLIFEKLA
ncbi:MAG: class I SAM-dependent methyltransferase [Dehalococcoidia bacterium]